MACRASSLQFSATLKHPIHPVRCVSLSKLKTTINARTSNTKSTLNISCLKSRKIHLKFSAITSRAKPFLPTRRKISNTRAMFTGLVEEMGSVKDLKLPALTPKTMGGDNGVEMTIEGDVVFGDMKLGDSIAVNGTCLTVTWFDANKKIFKVGLAPETLRKTSLGQVGSGSLVNLERSLQPTTRMGGHFVQGHVDGTGEIVSKEIEGDSLWIKLKTDPDLLRYIVPKGFITVDGTSLTVVDVFEKENCFNFMLVAYTQQKVVIPLKQVGDIVNLEVDILGKYVEKFLDGYRTSIPAKM